MAGDSLRAAWRPARHNYKKRIGGVANFVALKLNGNGLAITKCSQNRNDIIIAHSASAYRSCAEIMTYLYHLKEARISKK